MSATPRGIPERLAPPLGPGCPCAPCIPRGVGPVPGGKTGVAGAERGAGPCLRRFAQRAPCAKAIHEPPRSTRYEPTLTWGFTGVPAHAAEHARPKPNNSTCTVERRFIVYFKTKWSVGKGLHSLAVSWPSVCHARHSQRWAFVGNPGRCTRTTQNRWPEGACITTQRSRRFTTCAPSFSSRATSAGMSSVSMSR